MPIVTVTTRYNGKLYGKPDQYVISQHRKHLKNNFNYTKVTDTVCITAGDPDGLGDLEATQDFAIQSKIEVTDDEVARLKAKGE